MFVSHLSQEGSRMRQGSGLPRAPRQAAGAKTDLVAQSPARYAHGELFRRQRG